MSRDPMTYRVHRAFPLIALAGFCFCSYALLSDLGYTPPIPWFLWRERDGLDKAVGVVCWCFSLGLLTSFRVMVRLDDTRIYVKGFFITSEIEWSEIVTVLLPKRGWGIAIKTPDRTVHILRFVHGPDMQPIRDDLERLVPKFAPDAVLKHVA